MKVKVLYFAALRERLGAIEHIELPEAGPTAPTVGTLMALLRLRSPEHERALTELSGLRTALDLDLCTAQDLLHDGAEVAIFPPVTGG